MMMNWGQTVTDEPRYTLVVKSITWKSARQSNVTLHYLFIYKVHSGAVGYSGSVLRLELEVYLEDYFVYIHLQCANRHHHSSSHPLSSFSFIYNILKLFISVRITFKLYLKN